MATVNDVPFKQIPRQSALFLNYVEWSPAVSCFYQQSPTLQSLENFARTGLKSFRFPRKEIASILAKQNRGYGCDAATLERIGELQNPDCVAILTGQQVGIFTGPLYTIYKALSAICLADELKSRGIPAVPIFWMDTEDHDLAEVTHCTVLDSDSSLQTIDFRNILFDQWPSGTVGSIRFPQTIEQAVEQYMSRMPEGNGKDEMRSRLESTYRPGSSFSQSFAELLFQILPNSGLILFDPHDTEAKRLIGNVFEQALQRADHLRSALRQRSREIENSGFHSQVNVLENSTLLFLLEEGERRALEQNGSVYSVKNTDRTCSLKELLSRSPERFSPNVLLRPIVQDHLFPTAAYVGGSSEVAYFAQIGILYGIYGRPMPVIWPRDSFTLVEREIAREMDRFGIEFQDCFREQQSVVEKAVRNSGLAQAPAGLDELHTRLDEGLNDIKPDLERIESPLADALETARRKILHNVQHLKSQLIRFQSTQNSSIAHAVTRVLNNCYPIQSLQERQLGIQHFYTRYGASVVDTLRSAIAFSRFTHRVIRL